MDNKKFEQLIDLIINENEEQARALFHDIVVEKSREIYENMMDEDNMMSNQPAGPVQDLLDEIGVEESGMSEDEEFDIADMDDDGEEAVDIEMDDEAGGEEGLEDRVVDLEDKLDQLMAEFEEIMGGDDMGDDESDAEFDDEAEEDGEEFTKDMEADRDEEDPMMEAITLKKIAVTHGDNGVQTKSTNLNNSGQAGMDSKPVKFSGQSESVPTGPKGPSNAYAKGETSVKGAGSFKNAPAQNNADLTAAPKPVTKDEAGKVRSPVAESRRTPAKRRI
jgi:polyhydroxyalkanoate synthesis regulator phasin